MRRISATLEKGHHDGLLPIVPDVAELLLTVPAAERTGQAFNLSARKTFSYRKWHASRIGTKIGEAAGTVVSE